MQTKSTLNININKPYTTSSAEEESDSQPDKKSVIANAPIHSLKKDLATLNNPPATPKEVAPAPISSSHSAHASELEISPFLEKNDPVPIAPTPQNKTIPATDKKFLQSNTPDSPKGTALKKVFVFSIIFFSLVALGIGSYYFWLVREVNPEPLNEENPATSIPENLSPPLANPEPAIETTLENTLVLDLANLNSVAIKTELQNQLENFFQRSLAEPVEFKLRDPQKNLVPFSSFAEKSGITFAQNLSTYLGESFSLFVFNNGANPGIGLRVESKDDLLLAQKLREKETSLPEDLNVLFLTATPPLIKKISFTDFAYKDITLRYFNLISPEKLSVDYAVTKNNLIIGTTKATHLALYDWLLLHSDTL